MYEYESVKVFWSSRDLSLRSLRTNDNHVLTAWTVEHDFTELQWVVIYELWIYGMSHDIMYNKCFFYLVSFTGS